MLQDTDTAVLLRALEARNAPWSWFTGDWPLENHFYRPISTLTFEFDRALGGGNPAQYGLTNALLAALCIFGLFWLVRELTDVPWVAGAASGLFGLWHLLPSLHGAASVLFATAAAVALVQVVRRGRGHLGRALLALVCLEFVRGQIVEAPSFETSILGWLPGRTASTMLVFCLAAMAAYARWERLLPAAPESNSKWIGGWLGLAFLSLLFALGSYEQAIMLPACLLGIAIYFRLEGRRPRWLPHVGFWALLLGYLALRSTILPGDASGYQQQQFRSGPGVWLSLWDYILPAVNQIRFVQVNAEFGSEAIFLSSTWSAVLAMAANVAALVVAWRDTRRWLIFLFLGLGFVAFLPMAWLKHFDHYHYWPMAMQAMFLVSVAWAAARMIFSEAARPAAPEPAPPDPEPGSPLHP